LTALPGDIMGEGIGYGYGQRRVEKMRCPMCRPAQDCPSTKRVQLTRN